MSARVRSPDALLMARMRTGLVLLAMAGAFTGCATATRETPRESRTLGAATSGRPTLAELDQQCYAFADRYAVAMSAAVEALTRDEPDVRRIRAAHRLRASGIAGMFDIATGREPFAKAMDLVLVVTLQSRLWIDELGAEKTFGPEKGLSLIHI